MTRISSLVVLADARGADLGGKAAGLGRLLRMGLRVPPGFVIVDAAGELDRERLAEAYRSMGEGRVAVRSSAIGEDGAAASYAGQYETVLDVEGMDALEQAIQRCVQAASSERVRAYADARDDAAADTSDGEDSSPRINLVVQRMIAPRAAGVLFTIDPTTGRRDRVIVDAVEGIGEALVSGESTPDHYELDREGKTAACELVGAKPILDELALRELCQDALSAEVELGTAADLEWAIDEDEHLWWLQIRPVTAAPADPRELDSTELAATEVVTRSNIGEMMPGAVTPLTWSLTVLGIEHGMKDMAVRVGIEKRFEDCRDYVARSFGHVFLNLDTMVQMAGGVAGSSRADLCISLCGRDIPELTEPTPRPLPTRLLNGFRYFRYALTAPRWIARFDARGRALQIEERNDPKRLWAELDRKLEVLWEAYDVHLASSTGSGLAAGIMERRIEHLDAGERSAIITEILAGAGEVESAAAATAAEKLAAVVREDPEALRAFASQPCAQLQAHLDQSTTAVGRTFRELMIAHGHRALRELELRQPGWRDDPSALFDATRAALKLGTGTIKSKAPAQHGAVGGIPAVIVRWARSAVRRREYTKSLLVRVTNTFKQGYRHLGELLEKAGLLSDHDLVFFLTHEELGELVLSHEDPQVRDQFEAAASRRRSVLDYQMTLVFPEVSFGLPEPISVASSSAADGEGVLHGRIVSRGRVEGRARVAKTLAEASAVEPGEILIAPVTDVGWTPYFATIAGLATDIGSAVSHGAVVAREYGLPAVVNLGRATSVFRTGQWVLLDADAGTLSVLEEPAAHESVAIENLAAEPESLGNSL